MCGIAGYAGVHSPEILVPMCDRMIHRGPDDSGTWHSERDGVGLGHRRLSIIDLSAAGQQPMPNADKSNWITYNGEIYNFPEHRQRLKDNGYPFRSHTDTEVMLAMYEEKGIDFLQDLNGIFAFGMWDHRKKELLLARDHAGVKPLYYYVDGKKLYFASEIKALLVIPGIQRELHMPSLNDYLTFLWVPGENTLLSSIKKLEPGHYLTWKDGEIKTKQWFHLRYEPDYDTSVEDWVDSVHDTFIRTTRRQMVSDVPLGAFLSGGLDSSSIAACMRSAYPMRDINAYTVHFAEGAVAKEQGVDDYPYAKMISESLGINLKSLVLKPDVINMLPKMVYHLDEPDADPASILSYLISKLAHEDGVKVLLSGTGGDEIFFGYRSYQAYRSYERHGWTSKFPALQLIAASANISSSIAGAQNLLARRLTKFHRGLAKSGLNRHMALSDWSTPEVRQGLLLDQSHSDADVPACMLKYAASFEGTGEMNLHSHLLIHTFLASHNFLYTDKSSMATSVEARVPFMDVELMRLCAKIPEQFHIRNGTTKYLLKRAMAPYIPPEVIYRKKTGFGMPLRGWIQNELHDVIGELLSPEKISSRGLFNPKVVQNILTQNATGKADHAYLIYALLSLELWMQTFLDQAGAEVTL